MPKTQLTSIKMNLKVHFITPGARVFNYGRGEYGYQVECGRTLRAAMTDYQGDVVQGTGGQEYTHLTEHLQRVTCKQCRI